MVRHPSKSKPEIVDQKKPKPLLLQVPLLTRNLPPRLGFPIIGILEFRVRHFLKIPFALETPFAPTGGTCAKTCLTCELAAEGYGTNWMSPFGSP